MIRTSSLFLAIAVLSPAVAAQSPEWPSWRGPHMNGHAAADCDPPLSWSEEKNVRYKVELPGLGNSSPIVCGDRIYLTAAIDLEAQGVDSAVVAQPGPPNADHEHAFLVLALDRANGAEVWRTVVGEGKPHSKGHPMGSHASASIHTDGRWLVAFFGSNGLYVLDMDGALKWSKDFGDQKVLADFGEGSSPALDGDTVVVQWDEEGPSFVAAFDVATGEERWRVPRDTDSSWGSPLVTTVDDRRQVILTGSDATRSYDLASGEEIWHCAGMSKNPVNSPTIADGVLYVMNSYKGRIIQAVRLAGARGALGEDSMLWTVSRDPAYVPLPVVHEGRMYYLRDSTGTINCVDAATGEALFRDRLPEVKRIHATPLLAQDRLYFVSREGASVVLQAGDEFEVLSTNFLDDEFDATPAIVGDEIYLRGRSHLYCIAETEARETTPPEAEVDRRIPSEPEYVAADPRYAQFRFGPEGRTRMWCVLDRSAVDAPYYDVLYCDRDFDGDLTEAGERFTSDWDEDRARAGIGIDLQIGDLPIPGTEHVHTGFRVATVSKGSGGRSDGSAWFSMNFDGGTQVSGGYAPARRQTTVWGTSPATAPVFQPTLRGPFHFGLYTWGEDHWNLTVGHYSKIYVMVGNRGSAGDTLAVVDEHYLDLERDEIWVTVLAQDANGRPLHTRSRLDEHC